MPRCSKSVHNVASYMLSLRALSALVMQTNIYIAINNLSTIQVIISYRLYIAI